MTFYSGVSLSITGHYYIIILLVQTDDMKYSDDKMREKTEYNPVTRI